MIFVEITNLLSFIRVTFLKSNAIAAFPTGQKSLFSKRSLSTLLDLLEGKTFGISSEVILDLSKFVRASAESNSVDCEARSATVLASKNLFLGIFVYFC